MATLRHQLTELDSGNLLKLVAQRGVRLPDVTYVLDYQDDVDTLCITFDHDLDPAAIEDCESFGNGVIGIYNGERVAGIEILNITGQMDSKLEALSSKYRNQS